MTTTEPQTPPGREKQPQDISLADRQQWGGEMGPGPYSFPIQHLRKLIAQVPETVDGLKMGPLTAAAFLGHPDVVSHLHLVESEFACGTVNSFFTMRGLARILVQQMEEGIVVAINRHGDEIGRISGALR